MQTTNVWTSKEEGGGMNWEIGIDMYRLLILCIKLMRIYCRAQGTLLSAL